MRISDWSSDVCSSDLARAARPLEASASRNTNSFCASRRSWATRRSSPAVPPSRATPRKRPHATTRGGTVPRGTVPPSRTSAAQPERVDVRGWLGGIRLSGFMVIMLGLVVLAAFVLVPTVGTYVDQRQQIAALQGAGGS